MNLLFDLDNTIIDSDIALDLRKQRNWPKVYEKIPHFTPYKGIISIIQALSEKHQIFIVTSSPSKYAESVCSYWEIPFIGITAYHDSKMHKPHPEPFLVTLKKFELKADHCISFGDHKNDIMASKLANIRAVGCLWGAADSQAVIDSKPFKVLKKPFELVELIQ